MSDDTLDDILRQLGGTTGETDDTPETPEVEEVKLDEVSTTDEDPLAGLLVDEVTPEPETTPEPEPAPEQVKKKRGRPKGSTVKKAVAEPELEQVPESAISVADVAASAPSQSDVLAQGQLNNSTTENVVTVELSEELSPSPVKDIYITAEAQIFNGHSYRRGQKISFRKGDKFYNSQFDRDGNNWLDTVDDLDSQYAKFGRVIVEPDRWSGIPMGSTEGITHPGIALALAKIAQEEYKRNGNPYN